MSPPPPPSKKIIFVGIFSKNNLPKNELKRDPRWGLREVLERGYPGISRGYQRASWRVRGTAPGASPEVPGSASEEGAAGSPLPKVYI